MQDCASEKLNNNLNSWLEKPKKVKGNQNTHVMQEHLI